MMDASFVQEIIKNAKGVEHIKIGGRDYTTEQVHSINPRTIESTTVHTLQAVVDFFLGEPDVEKGDAMVHVVDPTTVKIVEAKADANYRVREHFLTSKIINEPFTFGKWFDQDEMVINLMTLFVQTSTLLEVIKAVSGIVSQNEATISDDGISQEVKVRKGVQRVESVSIKNPIMLQPIRSFAEIEQVESPYVLRIKTIDSQPKIAIFEAGGGQWKNVAIGRIKDWLADGRRLGKDVKILG